MICSEEDKSPPDEDEVVGIEMLRLHISITRWIQKNCNFLYYRTYWLLQNCRGTAFAIASISIMWPCRKLLNRYCRFARLGDTDWSVNDVDV
jgi:hypothetical protein